MKRIAILQSNYIPWKGYFDIIKSVDEFVIFDEVQYTKNDWRNRNIIKGPDGLKWITIPCRRNNLGQKICETKIFNRNWHKKHLNTFELYYSKARCYEESKSTVDEWYQDVKSMEFISEVNLSLIKSVCDYLNISTKISSSEIYKSGSGRNKRLIGICKDAQAGIYLTGSSARSYLDEELFQKEGILVEYMAYEPYPSYQQLWPPFEHNVSIIDLIFNMGKNSARFINKN